MARRYGAIARAIAATMLVLASLGSGRALADSSASTTASVDVGPAATTAFSVSITGSTFSSVNYRTGSSFQNANGSIVVAVVDTRGTGAGWTVTLAANGDLQSGTSVIPIAALSFQEASVNGRNGANPNGIGRYRLTMSTGAQRILVASSGSGKGAFNCTLQGTIAVPDRTPAGTYTTTLTSGS
ncbi:MAG: WxL domain-containing protein [Thermomicrobiales bacterium]